MKISSFCMICIRTKTVKRISITFKIVIIYTVTKKTINIVRLKKKNEE